MLKKLLMLALLALPTAATGTTYYVDNCMTIGNDSNPGTSPSAPWLTASRVNGAKLQPGDAVLFERTCTWR